MSLKLNSSSGGSVTLQEPTTATNGTLTFPEGTGTVAVNGLSSNIVSGTSVASTSGTSINFTGIPSWVKRVTVMFNGVSTNGSSAQLLQIGAGSVQASGYFGSGTLVASTVAATAYTTGFGLSNTGNASYTMSGVIVLCLLGSNIWTAFGVFTRLSAETTTTSGAVTLSGALDRVRITTVGGTDTFDAGSINILYE